MNGLQAVHQLQVTRGAVMVEIAHDVGAYVCSYLPLNSVPVPFDVPLSRHETRALAAVVVVGGKDAGVIN